MKWPSLFQFRTFTCSAAFLLCCTGALAAPFVPATDSVVLERLRIGPVDKTTREIRQLRRACEQSPQDVRLATLLARRLISKSRETSDPRYLGQAESVLGRWWNQTNPPVEVLVLRATIRQSTHHFAPALADLDRVLALDPRNAQACLTRATILQVRGDYAEARRSCEPLKHLTSELIAVTCLSGVQSVTGDATGAYEMVGRHLQRATEASASERIWAITLLAEIAARLNRTSEAEAHFKSALALGERDPYLLSAYADFLLDQKRPRRVIELLQDETRADSLLLRLALAESALGGAKAREHIELLKARFEASSQRGDTVHQREEARFQLHLIGNKAKALALATENFTVQREPADVRILLEAAIASRDSNARNNAEQFVRTNKLEDTQLEALLRTASR